MQEEGEWLIPILQRAEDGQGKAQKLQQEPDLKEEKSSTFLQEVPGAMLNPTELPHAIEQG